MGKEDMECVKIKMRRPSVLWGLRLIFYSLISSISVKFTLRLFNKAFR